MSVLNLKCYIHEKRNDETGRSPSQFYPLIDAGSQRLSTEVHPAQQKYFLFLYLGLYGTSQGHTMNKRPCYPSDKVFVVLCVSPIVSASCESGSESSSWPPHRLWQDVPPTRRANVRVSLGLRGCPPLCLRVRVVSSHIHVSLPF